MYFIKSAREYKKLSQAKQVIHSPLQPKIYCNWLDERIQDDDWIVWQAESDTFALGEIIAITPDRVKALNIVDALRRGN